MEADPRFTEFVAERGDALLRYGYVLAGNAHDAADLVQEALLKLRAAWPRLRSKENPESYARTTMARLHIAAWRLRRRELLAWDLPEREHHDPLPSGDERRMWQALGLRTCCWLISVLSPKGGSEVIGGLSDTPPTSTSRCRHGGRVVAGDLADGDARSGAGGARTGSKCGADTR
ncbi:sigma factor [Nonomuraea sp. NPDC046802]|uniref:sigma factor n=1 Tax=Nonomuraea sp. NPDC046802 TaxID=3154919 RepID=UPI0033F8DE80